VCPERRNLFYSLILFSLIVCHVWPVRTSSTNILLRHLIHTVSLQPPRASLLSAEYSKKKEQSNSIECSDEHNVTEDYSKYDHTEFIFAIT
jgi:hypothetical protein